MGHGATTHFVGVGTVAPFTDTYQISINPYLCKYTNSYPYPGPTPSRSYSGLMPVSLPMSVLLPMPVPISTSFPLSCPVSNISESLLCYLHLTLGSGPALHIACYCTNEVQVLQAEEQDYRKQVEVQEGLTAGKQSDWLEIVH